MISNSQAKRNTHESTSGDILLLRFNPTAKTTCASRDALRGRYPRCINPNCTKLMQTAPIEKNVLEAVENCEMAVEQTIGDDEKILYDILVPEEWAEKTTVLVRMKRMRILLFTHNTPIVYTSGRWQSQITDETYHSHCRRYAQCVLQLQFPSLF